MKRVSNNKHMATPYLNLLGEEERHDRAECGDRRGNDRGAAREEGSARAVVALGHQRVGESKRQVHQIIDLRDSGVLP